MTRAKFTITLPVEVARNDASVHAYLNTAAVLAGGMTCIPASGMWVAPDGHTISENVLKFEFLADETSYSPVDSAVRDAAEYALRAGEQVVLVEHHINRTYGFHLYTRKDFT